MFRYLRLLCVLLLLAAPLSAEEKYWQYEFVEGDTIWSVSHRFLKNWRNWGKLQDLNSVTKDTRMPPGTQINIPVEWLDTTEAPVSLASVMGTVSLFNAAGDSIALDQAEIGAGYVLETAEKASALLIFKDGSKLLVQQNTRVIFDTTRSIGAGLVYDYKIDLPRGEVENRANPQRTAGSSFLIETPSSTTATRGTIYRVRTDGAITGTEVTTGLVGVGNALGEVKVPAGFGVITEKGKQPAAPVKLLPAPQLPSTLGQFSYLPASISLPSLEGAQLMRLQVSTSRDFDVLSADLVLDQNSWQLPLSIPDGHYYLRLRGIDAKGLQGKNAVSEFVVAARPKPAAHLSRINGNVFYSDDIYLQWSSVDAASEYLLEVALANDPRAQVYRSRISGTSHQFTLPSYGQFIWRVSGYSDTGGLGPIGHWGQFEAIHRPFRPTAKQPDTNGLVIEWSVPPERAYLLQLAEDQAFQKIVYQQQYSGGNSAVDNLPAGQYFARYQLLGVDDKVVDESPSHTIIWQP